MFYNGDIVLDMEQEGFIFNTTENSRKKRATVRRRDRLWKNGVLYFAYASDLRMYLLISLKIKNENIDIYRKLLARSIWGFPVLACHIYYP